MLKIILLFLFTQALVVASDFNEGLLLNEKGLYKEAMLSFEKACDKNDYDGCLVLGLGYSLGHNVKKMILKLPSSTRKHVMAINMKPVII